MPPIDMGVPIERWRCNHHNLSLYGGQFFILIEDKPSSACNEGKAVLVIPSALSAHAIATGKDKISCENHRHPFNSANR
jgi:hypothetical protein